MGVLNSTLALAAQKNIYVDSTNGNDSNSNGTKQLPYKSISAAVKALKNLNKDNKNDININIASGDYFLDEEIKLEQDCGGVIYWHVNFIGDKNKLPRIIGGKKISSWKKENGDIFTAQVGKDFDKITIVENSIVAREASYPNKGYIAALGGSESENKTSIIELPPNLLSDFDENCSVAIWPGCHNRVGSNYNWSQTILLPKFIDKKNGKIEFTKKSHYLIWKGNRCKLYGAKSFLDDKGEFFYDRNNGILYYIPFNKDISKSEIFLANLKTCIRIKGKSPDSPVCDIHFKNIEFLASAPSLGIPSKNYSNDSMIVLENVEDISFKNCKFIASGINAA